MIDCRTLPGRYCKKWGDAYLYSFPSLSLRGDDAEMCLLMHARDDGWSCQVVQLAFRGKQVPALPRACLKGLRTFVCTLDSCIWRSFVLKRPRPLAPETCTISRDRRTGSAAAEWRRRDLNY